MTGVQLSHRNHIVSDVHVDTNLADTDAPSLKTPRLVVSPSPQCNFPEQSTTLQSNNLLYPPTSHAGHRNHLSIESVEAQDNIISDHFEEEYYKGVITENCSDRDVVMDVERDFLRLRTRPFFVVTGIGCKYVWKKKGGRDQSPYRSSDLDFSVEKSQTGAISSQQDNSSTTAPADILITFGHQEKVCQPSKVYKTVECF